MTDNARLAEPYETEGDFQEPEIEIAPSISDAVGADLSLPAMAGPAQCQQPPRRKKLHAPISLSYHSPKCCICNHPEREAIEQGFLHWESPTLLAYEYDLGRRRAIYRHARAFGLFEKRAARTRRTLEFILEQAETVTPTADSIIRAVRASTAALATTVAGPNPPSASSSPTSTSTETQLIRVTPARRAGLLARQSTVVRIRPARSVPRLCLTPWTLSVR